MEEPLIIKALRDKRAEVHGQIAAYQAQIAQAKHDLAHVNATIRMFADVECQRTRYIVSHGFFKKGEIADLCVRHLQQDQLAFSRGNGRNGQDPTPIDLPMTRTDIGDFLGLTIETVSRTFSKLKAQGLIELPQSNRVRLVDVDELECLAEGDDHVC